MWFGGPSRSPPIVLPGLPLCATEYSSQIATSPANSGGFLYRVGLFLFVIWLTILCSIAGCVLGLGGFV